MKSGARIALWGILAAWVFPLAAETGAEPETPAADEREAAEAPAAGEESDDSGWTAGGDVPGEFLERYFARRPSSYLVDPQDLLTERERKERENFLRYHSGDSQIDLFVLLFDRGQRLPGDIRVEELGERFFDGEKPSLLVLYFLGEPGQAVLEFSPDLRDRVNSHQGRRLLEHAARRAAEVSSPVSQLDKFCVQVSIQLFMIEQSIGLGDGELAEKPQRGDVSDDIGGSGREVPDERSPGAEFAEAADEAWNSWGLPAAVFAGALVSGWLARLMIGRRRRYRFPEFEVAPRLGCDHAAGVGAKISFGTATRSPSEQKAAPADSLGGL